MAAVATNGLPAQQKLSSGYLPYRRTELHNFIPAIKY